MITLSWRELDSKGRVQVRYLLDTTLIVDNAHGYEPAMQLLHRLMRKGPSCLPATLSCARGSPAGRTSTCGSCRAYWNRSING